MAEFCLDCWNKLNDANDKEENYIMSKELDLCEGCGEWKHVIIVERNSLFKYRLREFVRILKIFGRIIILPYLIIRYILLKK